jgi:2-methylcitrate dehydratase
MRLSGGRMQSAAMNYPRGHHDDPMSDEEVNDKFRQLALRKLSLERAERALERIWRLEAYPSAGDIFELVRID